MPDCGNGQGMDWLPETGLTPMLSPMASVFFIELL